MAVTRERFDQGMTYDAYVAQMAQNKEQVQKNEGSLQLSQDDVAAFKNLPGPINVVAIVEDWCADVVANLPIVGRIGKESGKLNVHAFPRDQNKDLMALYMNGPFESIPVFVFFDEDFRELGTFIERPASVTKLRAEKRMEIFKNHPEFGSPTAPPNELPEETRAKLNQETRAMREGTADFAIKETVREVRAIVERVPVGKA